MKLMINKMKKNYLIYFVLSVIFFIILYSIFWQILADRIRKNINISNNTYSLKETNIQNPITVKGYPFRFIIKIPKYNINLKQKIKISITDMYISSNIFNYKKMKAKSNDIAITSTMKNQSVLINSKNYNSRILIDKKKELYIINHYIDNAKLLIKLNQKKINLNIKKLKLATITNNKNINLKIFSNHISVSNYNYYDIDSIFIDISINDFNSTIESQGDLKVWRRNGIINLNNFELENRILKLKSSGNLNIDKDLYLNGKFNFISDDPSILIKYLFDNNHINIFQYNAIKLILNFSTYKDKSNINIPIYLKSKKIFIGPVPIYEMQPINEFLF
ncbi:MAG: hypothetical protein CMM49_08620 [Rhodospirillaceae bacterium]|nr:hypothetical protein [Rhodospirillaceae bacterium]|tara:strand:+ start:28 stop:1029 length:1002 start_codon:yes stop_codon:yes gene_type:complete